MPSLARVRAAVSRPPSPVEAPRHAAVAAVLTPGLDLIFMLRAEKAGDPWSGHVSFPGGRVEPTDAHPLAAAIRETHEEIGLDLHEAEYLGALDPVAPVSGLMDLAIHPFVFALGQEPGPYVLSREVRSVHRYGLEALQRGDGRSVMNHPWRGREVVLPCVDFDGLRLWGLTLRIVDDLLGRLRD